jgi:hypothetical protein
MGKQKSEKGTTEVFGRLTNKQTLFIETYPHDLSLYDLSLSLFNGYSVTQNKIELNGEWKVEFLAGGPALLSSIEMDSLQS